MHTANSTRALPGGLSWFAGRARRAVAALVALVMAAALAATLSAPAGHTSAAAGDDATVVAGASWSGTRNLLRQAPGGVFDTLGASWS